MSHNQEQSTKAEKLLTAKVTAKDKTITIADHGIITIPAVACSKPTDNMEKITFMKTFGGGMQLHYNRLGKPETVEYVLTIPRGGKYSLTAKVATIRKGEHLTLTPNGGKGAVTLPLPHTLGLWKTTDAEPLDLFAGKNEFIFCMTPKIMASVSKSSS